MDPGKNYETKIVLVELFMSMAVRPGSSDMLQWLNTFIFLQKQNGTFERLMQKYHGISVGNLPVF
jgi:polar amino acid transport system substrate-binding protein